MAYWEWGDPHNDNVVLCVHGLTRTGRDFDVLAQALSQRYRVVCPDVVGRGLSDRLSQPMFYAVPQYTSDMVTLIGRLQPARLSWVGTSMGGLIGLAYAGLLAAAATQAPKPLPARVAKPLPLTGMRLDRLVLNDVGPHIEPASLARIGQYVGEAVSFDSFEQAVQYVQQTAASFGPHSPEQWAVLTRHTYIEQDGKWIKHYDLALSEPFKTMTPEAAAQGEAYLWSAFDSLRCPTLVVRGNDSDLLSEHTLSQMLSRNKNAQAVRMIGVGHAPTLMATDQVRCIVNFLNSP
ncbi:MAG: hypothetical protein RLY91_1622 [Pseudomonadota bacterium]|jgi:pimeloyl-ACP methyl ester carboxylesterase